MQCFQFPNEPYFFTTFIIVQLQKAFVRTSVSSEYSYERLTRNIYLLKRKVVPIHDSVPETFGMNAFRIFSRLMYFLDKPCKRRF